ncbi:hypothetical protein [Roseisalinus antarcticus]|uniref:hypothetical protein n=1 Tax=Roseisalinus antarcticus TaxID=254357 RepID=UPI00117AC7FF|nr:hypothetical protein [Roseisalinus antarcticus]
MAHNETFRTGGPTRSVTMVTYADAQILDVGGQLEVLTGRGISCPRGRRRIRRAGRPPGQNRLVLVPRWWCPILEQRDPKVHVGQDAIFLRDGNVWTSAGLTAGMDPALTLVEVPSDMRSPSRSPATT